MTPFHRFDVRRELLAEEIREDWLLEEDVSGPLAFEAKRRKGKLVEMIDEVGTYILDLGDRPDEEFFFFHVIKQKKCNVIP